MHGGTLILESSLETGTRFTVSLPGRIPGELRRKTSPNDELHDENNALPSSQKIPGRVLLVEDSPLNQELMKSILELLGCEYSLAVDGEQAVIKASGEVFDLILMDIDLPGIDGLEALRQIRTSAKKNTPVIALTAHAMKGDKERLLEGGMCRVLSKPINFNQIKELVREYCHETHGDNSSQYFPYEMKTVAQTLGIPLSSLLELIQRFFDVLAKDYMRALYQGITDRDHQEIRSSAHKLRGAVVNLRFETCALLLLEIEESAKQAQDMDYFSLYSELQKQLKIIQDEILPLN